MPVTSPTCIRIGILKYSSPLPHKGFLVALSDPPPLSRLIRNDLRLLTPRKPSRRSFVLVYQYGGVVTHTPGALMRIYICSPRYRVGFRFDFSIFTFLRTRVVPLL
ncbi:hypothetical protein NDU88_000455 [Pleurodeles waltl]|uniref:Uncharacterized protein n=1 Tax=Pleurodeles waltl TaxID=8319 RepID=A0AAV7VY69_PLEWA|nr:hypothetical protein NDU88_000455 [Pleurodeles waltl]